VSCRVVSRRGQGQGQGQVDTDYSSEAQGFQKGPGLFGEREISTPTTKGPRSTTAFTSGLLCCVPKPIVSFFFSPDSWAGDGPWAAACPETRNVVSSPYLAAAGNCTQ
jgi:hypothetical protein